MRSPAEASAMQGVVQGKCTVRGIDLIVLLHPARALPAYIVAPALPHDISVKVQLLTKSRLPFAIRSGGHASQPGAMNVENGITIDMRSSKEVMLYKMGEVVSVGPSRYGVTSTMYLTNES